MPITIITPDGTHQFDAKPEEVTNTGGSLKVTRKGQVIANFRRWTSWFETPASEGQE